MHIACSGASAYCEGAWYTAVSCLAARLIEKLPRHDGGVSVVWQAIDGVDALSDVLQVCLVPAGVAMHDWSMVAHSESISPCAEKARRCHMDSTGKWL